MAWRHLRRRPLDHITWKELYLFGLVIHLVMLALMFTLPGGSAPSVLANITLPVLLIYPPGTALLGALMANRLRREKLTENIKQAETKFKIVADNTYDWEYWTNPAGQFLYCSPSCQRITGYAPSAFLQETDYLQKIIYPEDLGILTQHRCFSAAGKSGQIEFRITHADGSIRWIGHVCVPVYDPQGVFLGVRGSNRDITERKQTELEMQTVQAELQRLLAEADQSRRALLSLIEDQKLAEDQIRRLNNELEQRVRDRTAQLKAANQELEAFSYSVSHDLRAPLRALDGFSDILLADYSAQLDEQGAHYLKRIRDSSRRMGDLINDLLNLSRITRADFTRRQIDFSALASEIANELKTQDPQRQVEFDISIGINVWGDVNLLRIALENLLSNAYKFTGKNTRAVISFGVFENAGEQVYFVRDNGAGFDMAYASKLFAPFQRLHSAQEYPGTGVGLTIVKRIITRHGGRIWTESKADQGTTFYFTLPYK